MGLKLLVLVIAVMLSPVVWAGDYMVELFGEHYREKMVPGAGDLKVHHTWQVKTAFGNKVLTLVGNDYQLRNWLRQYGKDHSLWVVTIPEEGDDTFKYNMAVYVNILQLQPVDSGKWTCEGCRNGPPPEKPPAPPPALPLSPLPPSPLLPFGG